MRRRILLLAAALLCVSYRDGFARTEAVTADQIIAKYMEAIGAERFPSITTFVERADLQFKITNPNVANLGRVLTPHGGSALPQRGTYQFYFKTPNLKFSSSIAENNLVVGLHGCDGKITWHIDTYLQHSQVTPKPGQESECNGNFSSIPQRLLQPNVKMHLQGKRKIDGHVAWEIKVDVPKSETPEIFFFDAETYLLIRFGRWDYVFTYSDYRDVGGIKQPFTIVREDLGGRVITTVRQVQINVPIDDARFIEPQVKDGSISLNPGSSTKTEAAKIADTSSPLAPAPSTTAVTEVNYPNFTTCTITELQTLVPELRRLKPKTDQTELQPLIEKIVAKLRDTARNTPNLISREVVTDSAKGIAEKSREYDYLILTRLEGGEIFLDEFRVDLKTGEKFQANDPGQQPAASQTGRHPLAEGFASSWVYFSPHNQPQSAFRYLGDQKLDGRRSVVLAFAQKPEAVTSPGLFRYQGRSVPMYFQGVAWFDPSDFRILRVRTELLSPLPDVALQQLSADIQFVETRLPSVSAILFLPRDVNVTSVVGGGTVREHHSYSDYRLFRAQSRIILDP